MNREEYQSLLSLLPELQERNHEISSAFIEVAYESPAMMPGFDWSSWEDGRVMLETQNFEKVDLDTLRKLITAIVRADRFVEGNVKSEIKNGNLSRIIELLDKGLCE